MKNFGRIKFFFFMKLQIEYLNKDIFVCMKTYVTKMLKRFYMDNTLLAIHSNSVSSLNVGKDHFRHKEKNVDFL